MNLTLRKIDKGLVLLLLLLSSMSLSASHLRYATLNWDYVSGSGGNKIKFSVVVEAGYFEGSYRLYYHDSETGVRKKITDITLEDPFAGTEVENGQNGVYRSEGSYVFDFGSGVIPDKGAGYYDFYITKGQRLEGIKNMDGSNSANLDVWTKVYRGSVENRPPSLNAISQYYVKPNLNNTIHLVASDPEGKDLYYRFTDASKMGYNVSLNDYQGLFSIDKKTGVISIKSSSGSVSLEKGDYSLSVEVLDYNPDDEGANGTYSTADFFVVVSDCMDGTPLTFDYSSDPSTPADGSERELYVGEESIIVFKTNSLLEQLNDAGDVDYGDEISFKITGLPEESSSNYSFSNSYSTGSEHQKETALSWTPSMSDYDVGVFTILVEARVSAAEGKEASCKQASTSLVVRIKYDECRTKLARLSRRESGASCDEGFYLHLSENEQVSYRVLGDGELVYGQQHVNSGNGLIDFTVPYDRLTDIDRMWVSVEYLSSGCKRVSDELSIDVESRCEENSFGLAVSQKADEPGVGKYEFKFDFSQETQEKVGYELTIDYGDGTSDSYTLTGDQSEGYSHTFSHQYSDYGVYKAKGLLRYSNCCEHNWNRTVYNTDPCENVNTDFQLETRDDESRSYTFLITSDDLRPAPESQSTVQNNEAPMMSVFVDYDDGNGEVEYGPYPYPISSFNLSEQGAVTYSSGGQKTIRYRFVFSTGCVIEDSYDLFVPYCVGVQDPVITISEQAGKPGSRDIDFSYTRAPNAVVHWSLGDNRSEELVHGDGEPEGAFLLSKEHVYGYNGMYRVSIKIDYGNGCVLQAVQYIEITDGPSSECDGIPDVELVHEDLGCGEYKFTFRSPLTNLNGNQYLGMVWRLGDGEIGTQGLVDQGDIPFPGPQGSSYIEEEVTHQYTSNGVYPVILRGVYRMSNGQKCYKDERLFLNVDGVSHLSFTGSKTVCVGGSAYLKFTGEDSGNHSWDFGDGTVEVNNNEDVFHTYSKPGVYTVRLSSDHSCNPSEATQVIKVIEPPVVDFGVDPACAGMPVRLVNYSVGADEFVWDFGNGETSKAKNPVVRYSSSGTYTIMLSANHSCAGNFKQKTVVIGGGVVPSFIGGGVLCVGENTSFSNTTTGESTDVEWFWDFGDGSTSTSKDGGHSYEKEGLYKVKLKVVDRGCESEYEKLVEVKGLPELSIRIDGDVHSCGENPTVLKGRVSNFDARADYVWEWRDPKGKKHIGSNILVERDGVYTLTVSNGCGEVSKESPELLVAKSPLVSIEKLRDYYCESQGGRALVAPKSGQQLDDYTITWSTGTEGLEATNLLPGKNYVVLEHESGCRYVKQVTVEDKRMALHWSTREHTSCIDGTGGALSVSIDGGRSPFVYEWADGQGSVLNTDSDNPEQQLSLTTGSYKVKVTDAYGCVSEKIVSLRPPQLGVSIKNTRSCGTDPLFVKGKARLNLYSGSSETSGYDFRWHDYSGGVEGSLLSSVVTGSGSENESEAELGAGDYLLKVSDLKYGCIVEKVFSVELGESLALYTPKEDPTCRDGGSIRAVVGKGMAPYEYSWLNGNNEEIGRTVKIDHLEAGDYSVKIKDAAGCQISSPTITLTAPIEPEVVGIALEDKVCESEASLTVVSTPNYSFSWKRVKDMDGVVLSGVEGGSSIAELRYRDYTSNTSSIATGLKPGYYVVEVEDANYCKAVSEEFLVEGRKNGGNLDVAFRWRGDLPEEEEPPVVEVTPIDKWKGEAIEFIADQQNKCLEQLILEYKDKLEDDCLNNISDELAVGYENIYHHYTLFYYNRVGNLIKTVPPEGVNVLDVFESDGSIKQAIKDRQVPTSHELVTEYAYNSFDQQVSKNSPAQGFVSIVYSAIGEARFSQDGVQLEKGVYSYTIYDELGKEIEKGESSEQVENIFDSEGKELASAEALANDKTFPSSVSLKSYINKAVYSKPGDVDYFGKPQRFLQNSISYTLTDEDGDINTTLDQTATYYSYDAHGNVEWIIKDLPGLTKNYIAYEYDLTSGKVLKVKYNENRKDRFFHRYEYDSDNRLVAAYTSTDNQNWEKEASYDFYDHGALERIELGQDKVQGVDYTHTIGGWLKAINHPDLIASQADQSGSVVKDAFGMSLGYHDGDFKHTGSGFENLNDALSDRDLYNGNISSWELQTVAHSNLNPATNPEQYDPFYGTKVGKVYTYDQLQRIKSSSVRGYDSQNTQWLAADDKYSTSYEFDGNGNLQSLNRYGYQSVGEGEIDKLVYEYESGTNHLTSVTDLKSKQETGKPYEGENSEKHKDYFNRTHTYAYDESGNLIEEREDYVDAQGNVSDLEDQVTHITWRPDGKIAKVEHFKVANEAAVAVGATAEQTMRFMYDAGGNRILKDVIGNASEPSDPKNTRTYYVRDEGGNIRSTYKRIIEAEGGGLYTVKFRVEEIPLYGGGRLGMVKVDETDPRYELYSFNNVPLGSGEDIWSEINDLEFDVNNLKVADEVYQWITPRVAGIDLGEEKIYCDTKLDRLNFSESGDGFTAAPLMNFSGKVSRHVAVAMSEAGVVDFYGFVAENYLGHKDLTVLLDREGDLLKGMDAIGSSDPQSRGLVTRDPSNGSLYYLITRSLEGNLYRHTIDMSKVGFGTSGNPKGEVVSVNEQLSFEGNSGRYMSLLEDGQSKTSYIYGSRYYEPEEQGDLGRTELLVYTINGQGDFNGPEVLAIVSGQDVRGDGQVQLSGDGKYLMYYNRGYKLGIFEHREVDMAMMALNGDRKSVEGSSVVHVSSVGGVVGSGSGTYGQNGDLFYTQRSAYKQGEGENQTSRQLWSYDRESGQLNQVEGSKVIGDVDRDPNGELGENDWSIYIPGQGEQEDMTKVSGGVVSSEALTAANAYYLSGALPGQVVRIGREEELSYQEGRTPGKKLYELTDHLENVRVVLSDKRIPTVEGNELVAVSDVVSLKDYYPYGMEMKGRSMSTDEYRFGFQGQETDKEWLGGAISFKYRVHDPRVGRFLSVDPLAPQYPHNSPYAFSENTVIDHVELEGLEKVYFGVWGHTSKVYDISNMTNDEVEQLFEDNNVNYDSDWFDPNDHSDDKEHWQVNMYKADNRWNKGTLIQKYASEASYSKKDKYGHRTYGKPYFYAWERTFFQWFVAKDDKLSNPKEGMLFAVEVFTTGLGLLTGGTATVGWQALKSQITKQGVKMYLKKNKYKIMLKIGSLGLKASDIAGVEESFITAYLRENYGDDWANGFENLKLVLDLTKFMKGVSDLEEGVTLVNKGLAEFKIVSDDGTVIFKGIVDVLNGGVVETYKVTSAIPELDKKSKEIADKKKVVEEREKLNGGGG